MLIGRSTKRTPEQRSKKMINEEMMIMGLGLAIKKEKFKNKPKGTPEFNEAYTKVTDKTPHEVDMSTTCWCANES